MDDRVQLNHDEIREWLTMNGFDLGKLDLPSRQARPYKQKYLALCNEIWRLIARYGETGYGNKPITLSTTAYWIQHLDFENFFVSE